jgi:L-lactate dehydrogenase complex protein LldE
MKIGLFIPCYIDQFYPPAGIATLQLLEKLGCEVVFPLNQTCCGQPMANSGFANWSKACDENFINNFQGVDYIVSPSGSCTLHIREHLQHNQNPGEAERIRNTVFELTEFLTDILKIEKLDARFPFKVGLHNSCHGQRGLHLSSMSEKVETPFSKPGKLLAMVDGLQLSLPTREDECCGFGGTFCVFEEALSVKMGKDRIKDHARNNIDYLTATDSSCLMHLEGILRRQKSPVKIIHIAEILNAPGNG